MSRIIAIGVRASEPRVLIKQIKTAGRNTVLLHSRTLHDNFPRGTIRSTFLDAFVRDRAEYIPIHFSRIPQYFDRLTIDIAVLQAAYDPKRGYSFGTNPDNNYYFRHAKEIWVEVNEQMPWTFGPRLPASRITKKATVDYPLTEYRHDLSAKERRVFQRIAGHLHRFIKSGSTIQLGIGKLQSTLRIQKKVSVYSEMIGDWVMHIPATKIVGGFAMGSEQLYRWLDHNPKVELRPIGDITNPLSFTKMTNLVSINAALEVDLFGQAASESLRYRQLSGTGGSNDFTAGAAIARNGISILAMPSVTSNGKSKIVPRLQNIVTIPRADVDYIITEFGVAPMRFRTVRERAEALIRIAHPRYRRWLRDHWSMQ